MEELYEQLLQDMELALNELASKVPPPQPVPFASSFVYRHIERMPHQAIVGILRGETIKKAFLEDFFQEEFDNPPDSLLSTQSRRIVPRKKIQAYPARVEAISDNPSQDQEISRTPKCRIFWLCTRSIATDYGDVWRNPSTFSCSRDARYAHRSEPLQK